MTSSGTGSASGAGTAVVIGGGLAGLTAAWALRGFADRIVVVERDRYPEGLEYRPGVPQARHAHLVMETGHRVLEEMMPGIGAELTEAGAEFVTSSRDLRWLCSAGWMAEYEPTKVSFLCCTRPLLDKAVLDRVRADGSIEFLESTETVGLLGSARAVTGVRLRSRASSDGGRAEVEDLPAQLVVDATGRRSSVPDWLVGLGHAPVPEEQVDAGVAYATRLFHRPPGFDPDWKALYVQTSAPHVRTLGTLLPVEGDRWIVGVGGMRGAEPEPGEEGYNKILEELRHPILREALRDAEPATEVRGFRPGPSVRRRYERGPVPGLIVTGDAATSFNPVYGQGVAVAALSARALRRSLVRRGDLGPATVREAQRGIMEASKAAWMMSSSEDVRFPATTGGPSGALVRLQHRALDRVLAAATRDPAVTSAFHEVLSLTAPPSALLRPKVLAGVLRG
ncbi:NAD(P)/FAD-dependent oxidoreductase [Kitasatospora sp. NPDC101183]|uniref:NAD(P)/FAD-dependent oxidoreductase n=1 Tax=Kitasatospora sp. NPDC101183 TaxID=3364100 RepID=UPI0038147473